MKLGPEPQVVAPTHCQVGEGPLWHPEARTLFFVDITQGDIYAYKPDDGSCRVFTHGPPTAGLTLQTDGGLLLFQDGRISRLGLDGAQKELISGLHPGNERFNDVVADPEGRVFAGSMGPNGKLFRFDPDGRKTQVLDGLGVPNGMDFTLDLKQMYFTESISRRIYRFDYDAASGNLSNQRVFIEIPQSDGVPDGLTIDADGYVWTAIWGGSRIKRYAPDGRFDREIHFPSKQISALAFGGANLDELYVTSAAIGLSPGRENGNEGALFGLRLAGIRGRAPFRSRLFQK